MTNEEYNDYIAEILEEENQAIDNTIGEMRSFYEDMMDEVFNELKEEFCV